VCLIKHWFGWYQKIDNPKNFLFFTRVTEPFRAINCRQEKP
jgi:hypothetical protein